MTILSTVKQDICCCGVLETEVWFLISVIVLAEHMIFIHFHMFTHSHTHEGGLLSEQPKRGQSANYSVTVQSVYLSLLPSLSLFVKSPPYFLYRSLTHSHSLNRLHVAVISHLLFISTLS